MFDACIRFTFALVYDSAKLVDGLS